MCEGRGHRRTYVIKSSAPIKIVKLPNLHAPKKQTEFSLETIIYVNKRYGNPTEKTQVFHQASLQWSRFRVKRFPQGFAFCSEKIQQLAKSLGKMLKYHRRFNQDFFMKYS